VDVLVDSNVILDVVTEDERWFRWSSETLAQYAETHILVINPIICAEVSIGFDRIEDVELVLSPESFRRDCGNPFIDQGCLTISNLLPQAKIDRTLSAMDSCIRNFTGRRMPPIVSSPVWAAIWV